MKVVELYLEVFDVINKNKNTLQFFPIKLNKKEDSKREMNK